MSRSRQKCLHFCCHQEAVKALGSELLVTPTHPQVRLCVGLTKGHKFLPLLVGVGRGGEPPVYPSCGEPGHWELAHSPSSLARREEAVCLLVGSLVFKHCFPSSYVSKPGRSGLGGKLVEVEAGIKAK